MRSLANDIPLLGGRLAVDFVNTASGKDGPSWERFILLLEATAVVSPERRSQLLSLPAFDPQAAEAALLKARRLSSGLRQAFSAIVRKQRILPECVEPVNQILRVTEGHDELIQQDGLWEISFIARESGLDWLLAAIARSGAEIITEGPRSGLRICANPRCGLYFYDKSRTHRRRWCSMALCGNRSKVAAFARKHASLHRAQ